MRKDQYHCKGCGKSLEFDPDTIDNRWRMILSTGKRGQQILAEQCRLEADIQWLQDQLNRAERELTIFYSEIEEYIKGDPKILLEVARLDNIKACVLARRTVVKTSLQDAHARITGLLLADEKKGR